MAVIMRKPQCLLLFFGILFSYMVSSESLSGISFHCQSLNSSNDQSYDLKCKASESCIIQALDAIEFDGELVNDHTIEWQTEKNQWIYISISPNDFDTVETTMTILVRWSMAHRESPPFWRSCLSSAILQFVGILRSPRLPSEVIVFYKK